MASFSYNANHSNIPKPLNPMAMPFSNSDSPSRLSQCYPYPQYYYQQDINYVTFPYYYSDPISYYCIDNQAQNQHHVYDSTTSTDRLSTDQTAQNPCDHHNTANQGSSRVLSMEPLNRRLLKWVPKSEKRRPSPAPDKTAEPPKPDGGDAIIAFPDDPSEFEKLGKTTVMVKNIPNQYRREDLLNILNKFCKEVNTKMIATSSTKVEYDFVYLPMDFNKSWYEKRVANLGYAFVNFTTISGAFKFYSHFHKFDWRAPRNNKICQVTLARIQGKAGLWNELSTKRFFCKFNDYLPVMFNNPCDGSSSRRGRDVGIRVAAAPRHPINSKRLV